MHAPALVDGDQLGLPFPPTIERLLEQGPAFLTAAFHATGVLAQTNQVTAITGATEFFGGGMGRKLLLSVSYAQEQDDLDTDLFVKFPRDFGDPLRDLFGPLMQPECRFALLSRRPGFPITVPKCYFADYDAETVSGILITERIGYGQGSIEPRHEKCQDYEIADPLAHYRALTVAMARLCGHFKAGRFGADTAQQFAFDPDAVDAGSRIPYTASELQDKLRALLSFADFAPRLFEPSVRAPAFLDRFIADAPLVLAHEARIRSALNHHSDAISLCHWNMNLDNAWFWTDEWGVLQAGLLDWGSVAQMNVAQAFYGMTCAAETEFLDRHEHALMALFVEEYASSGGPRLRLEDFALQVKLAIAVLGIAWILNAPALIQTELADVDVLTDRHDPRLKENFLARAQLQLLIVFLNEWRRHDIGAALRQFTAGATP